MEIIETFAKVRNLKRDIAALHTDGTSKPLSARMQIIGETISDIIMPDLETSETESEPFYFSVYPCIVSIKLPQHDFSYFQLPSC